MAPVSLRDTIGDWVSRASAFFGMAEPTPVSDDERRKFRRIHSPVFTRPAPIRTTLIRVANISLGGVRVYSDVRQRLGSKLEIELFLPDETSLSCLVEVAWVSDPPADVPAKYEVGMRFIEVPAGGLHRLEEVLVDD